MSTKPRKPWPPLVKLRTFTVEQGEIIRAMCPKHTDAEIADRLNERFGTSFKASQISSFINNRGFYTGRDTTFKKGNRPWNDGTKGQGLTGRNVTTFKAGIIPKNTRPIGTERVDTKDGYIHVKTDKINPKTGKPLWRLKHIMLWEEHNGPVPPGHNVGFIDGDRTNITISNLELVERVINLLRNNIGYSESAPEIKPIITTIAKLDHATQKRRKGRNGKQTDRSEQRPV